MDSLYNIMKNWIFFSLVISSMITSCAQNSQNIKVLDVKAFNDSIQQKDVQLIDVRTPSEFNLGHLEGAKNIDFYSQDFKTEFDLLDKEKPIYIYCKSGNRSGQTANKLIKMEFKQIYDLEGGYLKWLNNMP